jgi:hypothetical protein
VGHPAHARVPKSSARRDGYVRRKPEETVLYKVVKEHFAAVRERVAEHGGLPKFVVREFEEYSRCGILSEGCLHLACRSCGHSEVVALRVDPRERTRRGRDGRVGCDSPK